MTSREVQSILLLLPGAFGDVGGIQMYNRLLIKASSQIMEERGGRCDVLILNDPPGTFDARYGTTATTVRAFSKSKVRFAAAAIRHVAATPADLIIVGHVHFGPLALVLRAVSRKSQQWFVTHGVDVWKRLSAPIRLALRKAEKVLSVSGYTRDELVACNDLQEAVVDLQPNALDPFWAEDFSALAAAATFPADPVLLTCARLTVADRYKGVDCVIRALPALVREYPRLRYDIIGTGGDREYLERMARDAGVAEHVRFCGYASPAELASAYAGCSLLVMPSRKEGFGIVFLEAGFFGKPSLGGAHGGTPEVVRDGITGWLVPHGDPAAIVERLRRSLSSDVLKPLGERARHDMEARFSFRRYRENLRALLSECRTVALAS